MSNEQRNPLKDALVAIGEEPKARDAFIRCLREIEQKIALQDESIRESITGPLLDAACSSNPTLHKNLSDGTKFEYIYRSKISRDIALSDQEEPDHLWEPQTTRLLCLLAEGVNHVVIGGAYLGDHAVLIARNIASHHGTVHAFEPNREQFELLGINTMLNKLTNLVAHQLGLWDEDGRSIGLIGDDAYAASALTEDGDKSDDTIKTTTITAYTDRKGIDDVGLIMLDVEGAEYRALQGAKKFLEAPVNDAPHVVFEIHRHYVDWSNGLEQTDIGLLMIKCGYTLFAVRDYHSNISMGDKPIELIPASDVYLDGPPHGFNLLATKTPERFQASPYKIVRGVSPKLLQHRDPSLHHPTE